MRLRTLFLLSCAVLSAVLAPGVAGARAADKIVAGALGSSSANLWPCYIGIDKGFFAAAGVPLDLVYAPSASGVLQQLTAGALDIVVSSGLVEPIHAVDKGAAVAILRIVGRVAPYALVGRASLASIKDLKGRTISVGGLADITRIYVDRMMAANGVAPGAYDIVVAGSTGARFAALQAGAIDAAILAPPLNFEAEARGFRNLGLAMDYGADLPFTGMEVSRAWAAGHDAEARRLLAAYGRSVAWFYDDANRADAVAILEHAVHSSRADVTASYDFYRKIRFFEPSAAVSRARLDALIAVQRGLGDVQASLTVDRLIIPGLTELVD